MRDAFEWWRKRDDLQYLSVDLHETGPVRAEYWEAMKEIDNLREFMRKERYSEDEIEAVCDKVH